MSLLLILKILEYCSAVIATIMYKKFASRFTALFLFYLWFICLIETLSPIMADFGYQRKPLYIAFTFFEFNILLLMYKSITKVSFTKKLILFFIIIFNIVFFVEFFKQGITLNTAVSTVAGSILISIILILYLKEFLYSDKILNYSRSIYFWITLGSIVYYLGSIPFQAIINYLENRDLYFLQISLAIFAQVCVIIGFLWSKRKMK